MTLNIKRRAEQQKVLRVLNAITCWAHWVNGIPKTMLEFVEIQLAETNSKLSKMGQPFRVVNSMNRFAGGGLLPKVFS